MHPTTKPEINPPTKTALELCKIAGELLETYSHGRLNPASFVDFEQSIARTHNCAGERLKRSHVIS